MKKRMPLVVLVGLATLSSACGADQAGSADDATTPLTTTTFSTTTTTTSVPGEGTEDPAADPAVLTFDDYLVAIINANADVGACGEQAERDFNDAQPADDEPTEAEAVEGGKGYFAGQLGCQLIADDAIAALQPPPEAVAAHANLVAARQAHFAASRAAIDAAETMDEITRAFVEPGPAVIEASNNWSIACRALEDLAASNGIDATLDCRFEPTG